MEKSKSLFYQLVLSDENGDDLLTGYTCCDMPTVCEQMDSLTTYFRIAVFCDSDEVVEPNILKKYRSGQYYPYKKVYNHKGDFLYIGFIRVDVVDLWSSQR